MAESVTVDTLEIEIESRAKGVFTNLDALADSMTRLKAAVKGGAGLTAVKKQLESLNTSLNGININTGKIGELATALGSLSTVQKASGLTSTINALKKLPQITASLNATDLNAFGAKMREVAAAVRPLANEMQKVSKGFSAFPIRIQKIIQSSNGLAASNAKASKSFSLLGAGLSATAAKLGLYYLAFKRLASKISEWITESNAYVENLNLFTVAMGKSAESAISFAEEVQRAMGIDSSEWMRNQGVFMQISTGFGVVSEKAALMSQNMTQLGYDISSFFNISTADAMQKLQSGIAGEIEPLRRLGYAIDVATLQQVAFRHGITQSVNTMNQAQKSQLRYIAIMEQSGNVMGDLARTITTPANAMRILKQQTVQLSRALGNIFVPVIQALLPWVQAFVSLLTDAANAIAAFVGFEVPKIDYSNLGGLSSGAEEAENALSDATKAAKELKNATLGIDELNILAPQENATQNAFGGDLGLKLPEYDFLGDATSGIDAFKEKIVSAFNEIQKVFSPVTRKISSFFNRIKKQFSQFNWSEALVESFWETLSALSSAIELTVDVVAPFIESLNIPTIAYEGIKLYTEAVRTLKEVIDILRPPIEKAVNKFYEWADAIGLLDLVTKPATGTMKTLSEGIKLVANALANIIEFVTNVFSGQWQAAWENIKNLTQLSIDNIAFVLKTKTGVSLNAAKEWSSSLIKSFANGEENRHISFRMQDLADVIITAFKDRITTKYIESRSAITTWASSIKKWFSESASPSAFAQVAIDIVNGFKNSISDRISSVKSVISNWANTVISTFKSPNGKSIMSQFESVGENIIQGFSDGVSNFLEDAISNIKDFGNAIISNFKKPNGKSIISQFENIGENVIQGFIDGVSNLWEDAIDAIRDFASSIISSAKDELDEHSPSRIFKDIGAYTVQGFNIGVQREAASSLNVMNSWLTGIKDAIPSFGVGFEMDYSNIRSFNPESFTQGISANMTASGTATVVGFKEAMEEFYSEMLYPMINQIADDMRRQADKEETTVVNIGNRTVTEAVSAQQSANGYRFVTT